MAAASNDEAEVRALEAKEVEAILAGDVEALESIWAEDYVVNAPNNAVMAGRAGVVGLVRAGVIDYHAFARTVEHVEIVGDTAIALGGETVRPKVGPHAGQTIERRYTNVWRRSDRWRMVARHANVVPPEGQSLDAPTPD